MPSPDPVEIEAVRDRVRRAARQARGLCVITGAGMSAESGIPTFRDAMDGLWSKFDPMTLASEEGFRADPTLVWDWYAERRQGVLQAQPNAGHLAIADFGRRHPQAVTVVTQNVDDLHQRAGSTQVIRLHGDILQDRWIDPCTRQPACEPQSAAPGRPPQCAQCGNRLRPGVVWFGEALSPQAIDGAVGAAEDSRLTLVVGTSGAVWPAAGLAQHARQAGAHVVIVNPRPSEIDDDAHTVLRGTAAQLLPTLLAP